MSRNLFIFTKTFVDLNKFCNYQAVRFFAKRERFYGNNRKPLHLGTAKSKLTRFPKWFPYREGELLELQKLYNDYKCASKSLINYFKEEYDKISDISEYAAELEKMNHEEHLQLMERNRLENERLRKLRDAREAREMEAKKEAIRGIYSQREEHLKSQLEKAEEKVRLEKIRSKTFITPENLDEAIDRALEYEVDYNFAIDLDGNVYKGRATQPDTKDASKVAKIKPLEQVN